jgi:hypothetical protein
MGRLRLRVTRYSAVLDALERQLWPDGRLECRLGAGRVHLVLRGAGATRWPADVQLARALALAAAARAALAADPHGPVRVHAGHAVVVRFEDAGAAEGCDVRAQWECVVPAADAAPPGAAQPDGGPLPRLPSGPSSG